MGQKLIPCAIEDLSAGFVCGFGLFPHHTGHHAGHIFTVGQGCEQTSILWKGKGQISGNPIQEPVDVIAFVGLGTVDVLRSKSAPVHPQLPRMVFIGQLLVIQLHGTSFDQRSSRGNQVHATGAHVGIDFGIPRLYHALNIFGANVLIVEDILAGLHTLHGSRQSSILEICQFDVYTSCSEVAVAVEGGFVLLAGAVLNHSHL
mmetsp:Transcript_2953/g.6771  ORF Transcript_2953/g.6771 Transcript_2953/m.6771 type:complete len:203 (+) Transcript_2953:405-1013(+)